MYTIGLDLAVQAARHPRSCSMSKGASLLQYSHSTHGRDLDQLLTRARNGEQGATVQVVMEPTGMAWFPVAVYLVRHDVTVYLVNSQVVADLRRY
jgi:transposase